MFSEGENNSWEGGERVLFDALSPLGRGPLEITAAAPDG